MKAFFVATILACVVCEGSSLILIGNIQQTLGYHIPGPIVQQHSEMGQSGPKAGTMQDHYGQNHDEEYGGDHDSLHDYEEHRHHDECENEKAGIYIYTFVY